MISEYEAQKLMAKTLGEINTIEMRDGKYTREGYDAMRNALSRLPAALGLNHRVLEHINPDGYDRSGVLGPGGIVYSDADPGL